MQAQIEDNSTSSIFRRLLKAIDNFININLNNSAVPADSISEFHNPMMIVEATILWVEKTKEQAFGSERLQENQIYLQHLYVKVSQLFEIAILSLPGSTTQQQMQQQSLQHKKSRVLFSKVANNCLRLQEKILTMLSNP